MKINLTIPFCSKCKNAIFCATDNPFYVLGEKLNSKEFLSFNKNEFIYHTADPASGIYCIYSGAVKIFKPNTPLNDVTIHEVSNGEIFGFNSIAHGRFTNSAIALEDTEVCFIPLTEMHNLIKLLSTATEMILSSKC